MNKQTFLRGLQLLGAAIVLGTAAAVPASAAAADNTSATSGFNVVLSPPSSALEVTPGSSVQTPIRLENQGSADEHVKVAIMKFTAANEQGTPRLMDPAVNDESVQWVHFSETKFTVAPGAWHTTTVTISPPAGTGFGYYYAVVFSRDGPQPAKVNKQTSLFGSVASLILLDIKAPGAVRKADIASFSTPHKLQEFLPANFTVRMHNTGNTHVITVGQINIRRGSKVIATVPVNSAKSFILPKTFRVFDSSWNAGTPHYVPAKDANGKAITNSDGTPKTKLDWTGFSLNKVRWGKYSADLVMVYNDGKFDIPDKASLTFWVIPWRLIAMLAVVLVVFGAGLWLLLGTPVRQAIRNRRSKKYNA